MTVKSVAQLAFCTLLAGKERGVYVPDKSGGEAGSSTQPGKNSFLLPPPLHCTSHCAIQHLVTAEITSTTLFLDWPSVRLLQSGSPLGSDESSGNLCCSDNSPSGWTSGHLWDQGIFCGLLSVLPEVLCLGKLPCTFFEKNSDGITCQKKKKCGRKRTVLCSIVRLYSGLLASNPTLLGLDNEIRCKMNTHFWGGIFWQYLYQYCSLGVI